ncbi:metallophosphoesterase family protein [Paracoccus luteus]|uniref:metallophosphoesterase family protein n=1 Tax=Paracoccus luteus TaxID=2508543 RepID=UPI00106F5F1B|nr:metallophosphoesterase [Paracoccus luteus]
MTRIAFLTDLHFGFHRAGLVAPLLARLNACAPALVVVGGDLSHRGRPGQLAAAAAFLSRLDAPWMAVPGNHDLPLFDLPQRLAAPRAAFRAAIAADTRPVRRVDGVRVMGVDSTDPLAWQRGAIDARQIARVCATAAPGLTNVAVLHHPLRHRPGVDKALMRGAGPALAAFQAAGIHVVLTGHLHVWSAGAFLGQGGDDRLLHIQGGTALCARASDRQNEFALLTFDGPELSVERHVAPMPDTVFLPPVARRFSRASGRWVALD